MVDMKCKVYLVSSFIGLVEDFSITVTSKCHEVVFGEILSRKFNLREIVLKVVLFSVHIIQK